MKYPAIISKDDGAYLVEFPGLDGCLTEGESLDEALANAEEALNGWLESNYERELKVKEPKECFKLATKRHKGNKVAMVPVTSPLALAYQMRFSRKKSGGKKLQDMATLMELTQQNYSKTFENPKANPTLKTLESGLSKLGYFLEIRISPKRDELFAGKASVANKSGVKIQNFDVPVMRKRRA